LKRQFDFKTHTKPMSHYKEIEANSLVDQLLNHPTLTLLFAPSGGQKSLLALDLARSVAEGGEFLGYKCLQHKTLYVDGEMSNFSISKRAEQFCITELPEEWFGYLTPDGEVLDFNDAGCQEAFLEFVEQEGYRFIVFDNLRVLLSVVDENDAAAFQGFNAFVRRLRDKSCSVFVIHHSNKAGETYSGSSNLVTVFDYVIGLSGAMSDTHKQVSVAKMRDDTELIHLDRQYVSFRSEGFQLNAHAGVDMESIIEELLGALRSGDVKILTDATSFLRERTVRINNSGWGYDKLFNDFVKPYSADPRLRSTADLKELFRDAKQMKDNLFE